MLRVRTSKEAPEDTKSFKNQGVQEKLNDNQELSVEGRGEQKQVHVSVLYREVNVWTKNEECIYLIESNQRPVRGYIKLVERGQGIAVYFYLMGRGGSRDRIWA